MSLSIIIPTYSPKITILERTLDALKAQTLPFDQWELLLIDNASPSPLSSDLISWHPRGRVIREEKLGLTHARLRAIKEAVGELLVWCDDDNLLLPDYLVNAIESFRKYPRLGIAGGKSIPEYLETPEDWYRPDLAPLGCRDHGDEEEIMSWMEVEERTYPVHAPIGAGMVTRKSAIQLWADLVTGDGRRTSLGRTGSALTSGEDNDINLVALGAGWDLGYLPKLSLTHIIPPGRLTLNYQKRIARASFRDFVKVLDIHGIRPWSAIPRWSVPLRSAKAWFTNQAWRGPVEQIRWQGAIGQFEGRAMLCRESRDDRREHIEKGSLKNHE